MGCGAGAIPASQAPLRVGSVGHGHRAARPPPEVVDVALRARGSRSGRSSSRRGLGSSLPRCGLPLSSRGFPSPVRLGGAVLSGRAVGCARSGSVPPSRWPRCLWLVLPVGLRRRLVSSVRLFRGARFACRPGCGALLLAPVCRPRCRLALWRPPGGRRLGRPVAPPCPPCAPPPPPARVARRPHRRIRLPPLRPLPPRRAHRPRRPRGVCRPCGSRRCSPLVAPPRPSCLLPLLPRSRRALCSGCPLAVALRASLWLPPRPLLAGFGRARVCLRSPMRVSRPAYLVWSPARPATGALAAILRTTRSSPFCPPLPCMRCTGPALPRSSRRSASVGLGVLGPRSVA